MVIDFGRDTRVFVLPKTPRHEATKVGGGAVKMDTVLKFYLKSSDANERQAVEILDRLMSRESEKGVEVGEKG